MNASSLIAAVALSIAASTVSSIAQDKIDYWSPPVKLSTAINSGSVKERPAISREEAGDLQGRRRTEPLFSASLRPIFGLVGAGLARPDRQFPLR